MTDLETPAVPLTGRVRTLVGRARSAYEGHPVGDPVVRGLEDRLDEPLRVAVAGRVKSGKSTLLNALVGQPLAATDAGECTRLVTWYRHGSTYRAFVQPRGGDLEQARLDRGADVVTVDLGDRRADSVERVVIEWPAAVLRSVTFIDTPGLGSLSTAVSEQAEDFLAPEEGSSPADAVVYLARHLHGHDVRFLEAFRDDDAGRPTPVNAIGVLSRADEVGGGRLDALASASRVAARYRADRQVRRLCQTIVPVAGLLAEGSTRLTQVEFQALGRLAEADDATADEVLLSADRFKDRPAALDLAVEERRHLLALLGLFGVRLSRDLIRRGEAANAPQLAAALRRASGLDDLREVLATQFTARGELLKARAALSALARLLRDDPPGDGGALSSAVEALDAGTHELAELRLLVALRGGGLQLPDDEAAEVERLVGRAGLTVAERLDLDPAADPVEIEQTVVASVDRWRRRAEHPLADPTAVAAAQVVVRSYEGMLAPG